MISNIGEEWSNFKRSEETQNIGIHDLRFTRWCRQRTYSGFGFWGDYQNLVELLEDDNGVCGGRCKIGLVSAFLTLESLDVAKVRNETSSHRHIWSLTMWPCDLDRNVDNPNRLLKVGTMGYQNSKLMEKISIKQRNQFSASTMGLSDFQSHVLREFTSLCKNVGTIFNFRSTVETSNVSEKTDYPNWENRGFWAEQ